MAVQQTKVSKSRKRKRRTHWKLSVPGMTRCANCNQTKMPHSVCPSCGYYGGREVVRGGDNL